MQENNLTAIIKTYNNEQDLIRTLETLKNADEIIVIDENSTDDTTEIAKEYKARIIYAEKNNFKNVFLDTINEIKSDWLIVLKDDEAIQDKLFNKLLELINSKKAKKISKIYFPLKTYYFNKEFNIKSKKILRCFKKDYLESFDDILFEPILKKGKKYSFNKSKGAIYKYYKNDIEKNILDILDENKYILKKKENSNPSIFIKPFITFLYWYIFKKTFLEGKIGFHFAFLKAFKRYVFEIMKFENNLRKENYDF